MFRFKKAEIVVKTVNGSEYKETFTSLLDARGKARWHVERKNIKEVDIYEILLFGKREFVATYKNNNLGLYNYLKKRTATY